MKSRSELKSIAKKGSSFHGLFEVAFISSILPITFLSSFSIALANASL
ncbi:MAG: hypothetical protein ACP5D0_08985 [Hydrogenovibrio sp.]